MPTLTLPDGATLHHETHGAGEPLLLVTGTSASVGLWTPAVIEALAADHQVILYDHRGMGASSPTTAEVTVRSLADDAASLLDHLGLGAVHVLGWSLGSAIAQELALARPDLVASLVLYATWARVDGFQRSLLAGLRAPWVYGDLETAFAALGVAYSPQLLDSPDFPAAMEAMLPLFPQTPEQVAMTVRQWDADLLHDTHDRLHAVTAPTTILSGEQDLLTPPWQNRVVADLMPNARLVSFEGPGSSHCLHVERAEEWIAHVREHLAAHALSTAG